MESADRVPVFGGGRDGGKPRIEEKPRIGKYESRLDHSRRRTYAGEIDRIPYEKVSGNGLAVNVRAILAPYDSGHRGVRMGRGPEHLVRGGLADALSADGHDVEVRFLESENSLPAEVAVAFELDRLISREVRDCRESGDFPLVLSGNCNNSVGTVAGVGGENLGVVWFDGHADFHTPDTTNTGFSDNMGLSIAVGHCWKNMAASVPNFSPAAEKNVVLVGVREIEPEERKRLSNSEISVFEAGEARSEAGMEKMKSTLEDLGNRTRSVYLHLDLDFLDPESVGAANEFAPPDGLTVEEAERIVHLVREHCEIAAVGVASYDPAFDDDGSVLRAGLRLVQSSLF
ncbi:arginase family protein [soil metagenome]|jgi:arginase|nr:arginase family protein [Rubrobacter sp.]